MSEWACDRIEELSEEIKALRAQLNERIRVAWHAGFASSGEGWNGEYPFGHPGRPDDEEKAMLEACYQEFHRECELKGWFDNAED